MGKNASKLAKAKKKSGKQTAGGLERRLSEPAQQQQQQLQQSNYIAEAGFADHLAQSNSTASLSDNRRQLHTSASAPHGQLAWVSPEQLPAQLQQQQQQQQQQQRQQQQQQQPPPSSSTSLASGEAAAGSEKLRALFSFEAQVEGDMSFRKGDILQLLDATDAAWLLARNQRTRQTGYVPYNYVQVLDGSPSSLECWFDLDRREAERNLMLPGLPRGSYLLRPCHQAQGQASITLSVRAEEAPAGAEADPDDDPGERAGADGANVNGGGDAAAMDSKAEAPAQARRVLVKHYMVREGSGGYFVNPSTCFHSVMELLDHYRRQRDGLCCRLSEPCPRRWMPPLQLRDFEVNRQSLTLLQALGHGSFGEVFQAYLGRLVVVAVKAMKPGSMNKEEFLAEAKLHYRLHHPRVVQLLGVCTLEEPFYIITEYMRLGALSNYLRRDREHRQVTFSDMTDMMYQIADGMTYLAQNCVVHRDLRAANILVSDNNIVKVSDFGLSKCLSGADGSDDVESRIRFPVRWTAPEAAKSKRFTTESDVWSFGVLLYEIVTRGELPYKHLPNKEIIPMVSDGYRLENPNNTDGAECDDYLYDVMLHCWMTNPAERPSFEQLGGIFKTYAAPLGETGIGGTGRRPSEYSLSGLR